MRRKAKLRLPRGFSKACVVTINNARFQLETAIVRVDERVAKQIEHAEAPSRAHAALRWPIGIRNFSGAASMWPLRPRLRIGQRVAAGHRCRRLTVSQVAT